MENRYWIFVGEEFYPSGGMEDFIKSSENLEELKSHLENLESFQWAHIYDSFEKKIILETKSIGKFFESKYIWIEKDAGDGK